jgi:hypothetical protein
MEGWTFAALALGVVLCFEFVLFRYFTPDRSTAAGLDGAGEPPDSGRRSVADDAAGGRGARGERGSETGLDPGPEHTVACERCGAVNADEPAVVFCRSCLDRLR